MSGHSKWAQIRHKKAGTDARRGTLFSKLSRVLSVAAREGGRDPAANAKLRQAVEQARDAGMPKENIERAISRGAGSGEGTNLRAVEYEAYGPGGSAFLMSGLTDNPNRTTNEIKHLLDAGGGRLATAGSVAWLFERRMLFEFAAGPGQPEETELALIDSGAEDTDRTAERIAAFVPPARAERFQKAVVARGLAPLRSQPVALPKDTIAPNTEDRLKAESLLSALENHPDITEVWDNLEPHEL